MLGVNPREDDRTGGLKSKIPWLNDHAGLDYTELRGFCAVNWLV